MHHAYRADNRRGALLLVLVGHASAAVSELGCDVPEQSGSGVGAPCEPQFERIGGPVTPVAPKVDLLFVLDNSMAAEQGALSPLLADSVREIIDPPCVDVATGVRLSERAGGGAECPPGSMRGSEPIHDLHVGIITTSLGGLGSGACSSSEQEDDRAHLLGTRPRARDLPTYRDMGFLAYDAFGFNSPPGEWNPDAFVSSLNELAERAGNRGCGFEMPLEAAYRFLADPAPWEQILIEPCPLAGSPPCARTEGVDQELLAQRNAFLRSDSLAVVAIVSNENDCSTQHEGRLYYALSPSFVPPAAASRCAVDPNDPCCYSCALGVPQGCSFDPACGSPSPPPPDPYPLRCFDQKRRFGVEFRYPVQRYVGAFGSYELCTARADLNPSGDCPDADGDGAPDIVQNPLVWRDGGMVAVINVGGVPWEDLVPVDGLGGSLISWERVIGDPAAQPPVPPQDPLMIESIEPRTALGGSVLAGPDAGYLENPINGHEWNAELANSLQHACIFELPVPVDCAAPGDPFCECALDPSSTKNPICQAPDGSYGSLIRFGSARPAIRQLEVVRELSQGWKGLGSICPPNLTDPSRSDYGFRPPIGHVMANLFAVRHESCLPATLEPDGEGRVECRIIAVRRRDECTCDAELHERPVDDSDILQAVHERLRLGGVCGNDAGIPCDGYCACEVEQLTGAALEACQNDPSEIVADPETGARILSGWCYLEPDLGFGNPALVSRCRPTERRLIRFTDPRTFGRDRTMALIACSTLEVCEER